MEHVWVRAEERPNEARVGLTPEGVAALSAAGFRVTVEESAERALPIAPYRDAGAAIAPAGAWRGAPADAWIFGLKELPDDGTPLAHRHIMFGHAYKGQEAGQRLLARFRAGGGTLCDLEYLVDASGRRVAAFGYWAGYAGAAMSLLCLAAQRRGAPVGALTMQHDARALQARVAEALLEAPGAPPTALVIGALGRVGSGATDFLTSVGIAPTRWDMAETAHGGPFPEVLAHEVFLNCILAGPGTPVFVPRDAGVRPRALRVIGDIACDPGSDFSPVPVYDRATTWDAPALRVHDDPPLDVMAIDNLPSLLPREASEDFAAQLLPHLLALGDDPDGVWARAHEQFRLHSEGVEA